MLLGRPDCRRSHLALGLLVVGNMRDQPSLVCMSPSVSPMGATQGANKKMSHFPNVGATISRNSVCSSCLALHSAVSSETW